MTLGATLQSIYRYVMKRGLRQVALGVLIGLALAMPASWARGLIDAFDGSVYAISALILLIVSLSATGLPAYRATEVDPIQALRDE
jgi:ABC-type antimicrobial peptide transport system permease subunit